MSREVRRVPQDWEHPKDQNGHLVPLHDRDYAAGAAEWEAECAQWCNGLRPDYAGEEARTMPNTALAYALWAGDRPTPGQYMPDWPKGTRTHYQMYEDTTEGTPISPVLETPEALAHWLVDNDASSFADRTANYEQWLRVCRGGFAPSLVSGDRGLRSGVEALSDEGTD